MRYLIIGLGVALAAGAWAEWEIVSSEDLAAASAELSDGKEVLAAVPDAGGGVCFVYHRRGLKFGRWSGKGAAFEYSAIDPNWPPLSGVVLAPGPDGRPHVAYGSRDGVTYAFWNGVSWSRSAVPTQGIECIDNSRVICLAVDSRNEPHLVIGGRQGTGAPEEFDHGLMIYASRRDGRWRTERLDSLTTPWVRGLHASLAVDGNGDAHVCYCWNDGEREELKYLRNTGGAWETELIASAWHFSSPSLAFDAAGRLHLAYFDESRGDLKYASREQGRWEIETVEALGWVGAGAALTFDGEGVPCISYYEYGPKYAGHFYVKVARRAGQGWEVTTVEKLRDSPNYPTRVPGTAVTVRGPSRAHVIYGEYTDEGTHLKSAKWVGADWPPADPAKKIRLAENPEGPEIEKWEAGGEIPLSPPQTLYAEPDEDSGVIATFDYEDVAPFEVLEAVSILRYYDYSEETLTLTGSERKETYTVWSKARREGKVGWSDDVHASGHFLVEFRQPYAPVREGPSAAAPVIEGESYEYPSDQYKALRPAVPAGSIYDLKSAYNGWYCVGIDSDGAWVPADAPGVTAYRKVFGWCLEPESFGEGFGFYFPLRGAVDRVIMTVSVFLYGERLSGDDPVLTITTAQDEFVLYPEFVASQYWYENTTYSFVAPLPRAVGRDEITAITFETGAPARRFKTTVDPREAWGDGAGK